MKNKRVVIFFSTWDVSQTTDVHRILRHDESIAIQKPVIVLNYTINMGAVERGDYYVVNYFFLRKSLKWWR